MIFACAALLQEHSVSIIPNDHGKSAMQKALPVNLMFLAGTDLAVVIVDENDFL